MCLAIPAKISMLQENNLAQVDILGVKRQVALDLTPRAQEGDYVLVHAGFAIEVVDQQFAEETIELIRQFPQLVAEELPLDEVAETAPEGEALLGARSTAARAGFGVA